MDNKIEYCTCKNSNSVHTEFNDWYEWDVCNDCNKMIEDSIRELNHYDGEDHVNYDCE